MKTLLLIDIQNDFLEGGALAVPDGNAIIPIVNRLSPIFGLVVATQDWHPGNHQSFASMHPGKNPFETIYLQGQPQTLWPNHCVQGSKGAEFSTVLNMNRTEAIFRKGTDAAIDSYSGFYDNEHRKSTGLAGYLREKSATEIYLAGLAGDYCVYFSAMDSLAEGFKTFVIEDATRPIDQNNYSILIKKFVTKGGQLVQSSVLLH
jgi:nicotinamidase/pyrazinamidase